MMRIKWNRHLDGSSSRRQEDEAGTQEADEKKRGSSSPGIFKIFRRKKNRRHGGDEDDSKNVVNNDIPLPMHAEANEDDNASISSVATCASQPVTDGFQRERASSLFSSFRLSLPGSKRKKRKIAPTPSEILLNGQEIEPQIERYSTPDLRKTSDKLDTPKNAQINLSTSSPSIRNPKGSSTSAQSLDAQNSECLDKLKWSNIKSANSSGSKLSKSVSFSDCGDGLIDSSSHSKRDNKVLWAVNSTAMVEEDPGALESELPTRLGDNPRMSQEIKFTVVDDSPNLSVSASCPQKKTRDETVSATVMTKAENESSSVSKESVSSDIGNVLSDIVPENKSYEKANLDERIYDKNPSPKENLVISSINCNFTNARDNYCSDTDTVLVCDKIKESEVCVDAKKTSEEHLIELTGDFLGVCDRNSSPERIECRYENPLLYSNSLAHNILEQSRINTENNSNVPLGKKLDVLTSELSVLTKANDFAKLRSNSDNFLNDQNNGEILSGDSLSHTKFVNEIKKSDSSASDKNIPISNSKHVLCHMTVYETKSLIQESVTDDKSLQFEYKTTESPSGSIIIINGENEDKTLINSCPYQNEPLDKNISISTSTNFETLNLNSASKCDSNVNNFCALNSCGQNKIDSDQKVPEHELFSDRNRLIQNDQKVPEFELSLLEFEEVCNKYMSRSNPELSECNSRIPLYSNSPKRKSVLDVNLSSTYSNAQDNGFNYNMYGQHSEADSMPFSHGNLLPTTEISHSLQNPCQILTEDHLPPPTPKQWINYEKSFDNNSNRDESIDGVQCTTVRGKNLCQEPTLEALPTTVMPGDSQSEGIDTPQLSSTFRAFENKSGRDHNTTVNSEQQHLSYDKNSQGGMITDVGRKVSTLNGVLDYSFISDTSGKACVYLDTEIRDSYRAPRAICDPLVYSTEVSKALESLGPENYLNGHNFSDSLAKSHISSISDVSRDYITTGNNLIEISNPYEEDTFLLPQDLSNRNFMRNENVSLPKSVVSDTIENVGRHISCINPEISDNNQEENSGFRTSEMKEIIPEKSATKISEKICTPVSDTSDVHLKRVEHPSLNGKENYKERKLTHVEQKNGINKNKNSMIPCRAKGIGDVENKKIETNLKSKKSNSLPRFNKSDSHHPTKNNCSHRVLSNSHKDSSAEHVRGNQKDLSIGKPNGKLSNYSSANYKCEIYRTIELNSNSCNGNTNVPEYSICAEPEENKSTKRSSSILVPLTSINNQFAFNDKNHSSCASDLDVIDIPQNELTESVFVPSENLRDSIALESKDQELAVPTTELKYAKSCDKIISDCASSATENSANLTDVLCALCVEEQADSFTECANSQLCSKHLDIVETSRRFSLPSIGMRKTSFTSSKESLSSQLTNSSNKGKSRIPIKQAGTRNVPSTKGPVRPPMWLSKAELTQEIQRLGTLCEARTKELNRLKMETKHVSSGFDAFAALFKYMVEDLNGLSVPALTEDLEKTLKQLELTKQDLAYYEREVEEMKSHHCQELNDLSNKLFEVYQSEVAELNSKHQEEINHLKADHETQIELLTASFESSAAEATAHHEKMIASLEQEIVNQREELQQFQEREIKDLEEKHAESSKVLQDHIEQLQKKCAELKQHSMSMEDAMQKDTDSKLQWVTSAKLDLEKEVESLKTVLEMKNKELHTIRVQNLEMEKQLEELPFAREKIKMLQARAEDLEALMIEKTKLERKLSTENQQIRDTYEKEAKVNRRLSMENEELQWRLRQAENSLISGSFSEVPEFPETEDSAATSPTKSPGPQLLSRSVFFTFVDKDESSPHSPRSQYKKITPNFSANYKTSPAKSSTKSPPVLSPRRAKSHSEPPQPITIASTPRKIAKQSLNKTRGLQKRQRSGSDSGRLNEHVEAHFSSVTESMASSVSSESSVFEHKERLLEEHKEQIIHSLEILREQRSTESSVDEPTLMEKKWSSDDIKITGELSNLETEDMSRSAEFADPKTYYHMTFPVLKESGITDCDIEGGSKTSSFANSPVKEVSPNTIMHSTSENNINRAVEVSSTLQVMSVSAQEVNSRVISAGSERIRSTESGLSAENVQTKASNDEKVENRWRTI